MSERKFLNELADLCEKHKVTNVWYTTDDDGVHVELSGEKDIHLGFLWGDVAGRIRKLAGVALPVTGANDEHY
jgi:hypothetical protein